MHVLCFQKDDHTGAAWDDKSDICVLKVGMKIVYSIFAYTSDSICMTFDIDLILLDIMFVS